MRGTIFKPYQPYTMNNLKPPLKLYTQADLLKILREEVVHALIPYNPTHSELRKIIKDLKKKYQC